MNCTCEDGFCRICFDDHLEARGYPHETQAEAKARAKSASTDPPRTVESVLNRAEAMSEADRAKWVQGIREEIDFAREQRARFPALYAVLVGNKSTGEHVWSLPTQGADGAWTPGDWQVSDNEEQLRSAPSVREGKCGFVLTSDPAETHDLLPREVTAKQGRKSASALVTPVVYLAEWSGDCKPLREGRFDAPRDRPGLVVRRVRLLRPLATAELTALRIVGADEECHADDCKRWHAYGNAKVSVGNAHVTLTDNAQADLGTHGIVLACGNSFVNAPWGGSKIIDARDNARVTVGSEARVRASDNAHVDARDSVVVDAAGNATVNAHSGHVIVNAWADAKITASHRAVVIRRHNHRGEVSVTAPAQVIDWRGQGADWETAKITGRRWR